MPACLPRSRQQQEHLIALEREKWEAFRRRDAGVLSRLYDERAISIGYAGDGSVGARRTSELLGTLDDLDIRELSLGGFEVLPVGGDSAVVTYRADFRTGRGINSSVMATSVRRRDGSEWRTMSFQTSEAPLVSDDGDSDSAPT